MVNVNPLSGWQAAADQNVPIFSATTGQWEDGAVSGGGGGEWSYIGTYQFSSTYTLTGLSQYTEFKLYISGSYNSSVVNGIVEASSYFRDTNSTYVYVDGAAIVKNATDTVVAQTSTSNYFYINYFLYPVNNSGMSKNIITVRQNYNGTSYDISIVLNAFATSNDLTGTDKMEYSIGAYHKFGSSVAIDEFVNAVSSVSGEIILYAKL